MTSAENLDIDLNELSAPLISPEHPKILQISEENLHTLNSNQGMLKTQINSAHHHLIIREVALSTLLFLIPIVLIIYMMRHFFKDMLIHFRKKNVVILDPRNVALSSINQLNQEPQTPEELSKNVVLMTDILRNYLEGQLQLKAKEKTSEELFNELIEHPSISLEKREKLIKIFRDSDLVKFAHMVPTKQQYQKNLSVTQEFISSI